MVALLLLSFVAGIATILAPCVLPLLPILIGSGGGTPDKKKIWIIPISLGVSIFIFTFLLKVSTLFIAVPTKTWSVVGGVIILFLGVTFLFPSLWERINLLFSFGRQAQELVQKAQHQKQGVWRDILLGMAFGPLFSSCSPTYFFILGTVLPGSLVLGVLYLFVYTLGLIITFVILGFAGQALIRKLGWATDAHGWFKRGLGILFILLGLSISFGLDKRLEVVLLDSGAYNFLQIEEHLLDNAQ